MKTKAIFKNNSQYIIPKIVENADLFDFDIYTVESQICGQYVYINVYYNISSKQTKVVNYLSNLEKNFVEYGYTIIDGIVTYKCSYIVPRPYVVTAKLYATCSDYFIAADDIKQAYCFYNHKLFQLQKSRATRESSPA